MRKHPASTVSFALLLLVLTGSIPPGCTNRGPESELGLSGYPLASAYASHIKGGASPEYALGYVVRAGDSLGDWSAGSPGEAVVRCPWFAEPVTVGDVEVFNRPAWGQEADAAHANRLSPSLVFVSVNLRVMTYSCRDGTTAALPVKLEAGCLNLASWSPTGRWVAVDRPAMGTLSLVDPATGAVERAFDHLSGWAWSADGRWLAFGAARRPDPPVASGSGQTADLAVFSAETGQVEVVIPGNSLRVWEPLGWTADGALAYRDAKGDLSLPPQWLRFPGATPPAVTPELPLGLDEERVGGLIPVRLVGSWTGDFSVSPDERFLAIACQSGEQPPTVFVGSLEDGKWFEVGPGRYPVWSTCPTG